MWHSPCVMKKLCSYEGAGRCFVLPDVFMIVFFPKNKLNDL